MFFKVHDIHVSLTRDAYAKQYRRELYAMHHAATVIAPPRLITELLSGDTDPLCSVVVLETFMAMHDVCRILLDARRTKREGTPGLPEEFLPPIFQEPTADEQVGHLLSPAPRSPTLPGRTCASNRARGWRA